MKDIHFSIALSVGMDEKQVQGCAEFLERVFHQFVATHIENGDHVYSSAGKVLFRHVIHEMFESESYDWHKVWGEGDE